MPLKFTISLEQQEKINAWEESLRPEILEMQKGNQNFPDSYGEVNYGAIGGGISYKFTPTGLGTILTVTETISGKTLDVTDYDLW